MTNKTQGLWLEFSATAFNCVSIFLVAFPFIKDWGFTRLDQYQDLLPLAQMISRRTNSLFLYAAGCAIVFAAGLFYESVVLKRFGKSSLWLSIETVLSAGFVVLASSAALGKFVLAVFLFRAALSAGLFVALKKAKAGIWEKAALGAAAAAAVFFFIKYLSAPLFAQWTLGSWIKLAWVTPLVCILFVVQERFPKFLRRIIDGCVFIVIILLVFKNEFGIFDYLIFLSAINDIGLGKDILVNVLVPYGFFNMYFAAFVFRVFNVQDYFAGLSFLISVLYACGYSACYIFLRRYTGNLVLSIAGLAAIFCIDFYYLHIPIHWLPQGTLLRLGSYLPVLFWLYFWQNKRSRGIEWALAATFAIMFFWVVEYGVYMLIALSFIAGYRIAAGKSDRWPALMGKVLVGLLAVSCFLSLRIYFKYHQPPQWGDLFYFQKLYATTGLTMNQLGGPDVWVIPVFIYWAAIYAALKFSGRYAEVWLFLGVFGLLFFLYFIGKGEVFSLARVLVPAIILGVAALNVLMRQAAPLKYGAYVLTAVVLVLLVETAAKRDKVEVPSKKLPTLVKLLKNQGNYLKFETDLAAIKRLVPPKEPLAVLSKNDSLYYIYAQRPAFFKNAFYPHVHRLSDLPRMSERVLAEKPKYFFVDNSSFQSYDNLVADYTEAVMERVRPYYVKRATAGFLDIYEHIE